MLLASNKRVVAFYNMPGTIKLSESVVPAVSNDIEQRRQQQQPTSKPVEAADDVICIDEEEDDSVLMVCDSLKTVSNSEVDSKAAESSGSVTGMHKSSSDVTSSEVSSSSDLHGVCNDVNSHAAAHTDSDDAADNEELPLLSDSDVQQQCASETANVHHSPSSRKVARLENLLKVCEFRLIF